MAGLTYTIVNLSKEVRAASSGVLVSASDGSPMRTADAALIADIKPPNVVGSSAGMPGRRMTDGTE
jgi:hypothetical protein